MAIFVDTYNYNSKVSHNGCGFIADNGTLPAKDRMLGYETVQCDEPAMDEEHSFWLDFAGLTSDAVMNFMQKLDTASAEIDEEELIDVLAGVFYDHLTEQGSQSGKCEELAILAGEVTK